MCAGVQRLLYSTINEPCRQAAGQMDGAGLLGSVVLGFLVPFRLV